LLPICSFLAQRLHDLPETVQEIRMHISKFVLLPMVLTLLTFAQNPVISTADMNQTPSDTYQTSTDKVIAGQFAVEPSTLISLGFQWHIGGDDNRNANVKISYRMMGKDKWETGLPLLRLQNEKILTQPFAFSVPNMFAGSIFDLKPDTEYEVLLVMEDPDGIMGESDKTVSVRTRAEPVPYTGGRTFHVYPPDYRDERQQPAFTGLLNAYYTGAAHADWSNAFPPRVQPGDVILVHAGLYKDNRHQYGRGMGTVFDGTYYLTQSGTPEKPVVIKAAGDGEVIFDGDGNFNLFNVMAADYNYFEGLTVRNTEIAFLAGRKNITGAVGLTFKKNSFEDIGIGIMTDWSGSKDFYIADNTFIGRNRKDQLIGWTGRIWTKFPGFPNPLKSNFAVKVYGSGHVIAFNSVAHFHDGIDHATYGVPDKSFGHMPVSIDIYNNDIFNVDDNCIEIDGAMHNIRVLRNRCFNHAHRALSAQTLFGGPGYFIRNIVYHAPEGGSLKFHATPSGLVVYHNTFIGEVHHMGPASNMHFRNNLILGQGAFPEIFAIDTLTNYSTSDYNGFRPNPKAQFNFAWNSPPFNVSADFSLPRNPVAADTPSTSRRRMTFPHRDMRNFKTLEDYMKGTNQDQHSILIDYGVFRKVAMPDPSEPRLLYDPHDFDFRLHQDAVAVDAGIVIPNVNDGFKGNAPDLGAYETGQPLPHYGPRS